jgi:5-methylcytosine-specific restriction endonuclease McrA
MSNAPCLHKFDNGDKCWKSVVGKGGYCQAHQPKAFYNHTYNTSPGWQHKRNQVLALHKGVCHVCGGGGSDQVDHLIPKEDGGTDSLSNLRPIHSDIAPHCHRFKTANDANRIKKERNTFIKRGRG